MRNYQVGTAPATQVQTVFNQTLSKIGPRILPEFIDLQTDSGVEVDLSPLIQNGNLDFIANAWVDNSLNAQELFISVTGSKQLLTIPANTQGYYPLLSPNDPKFRIYCATSPGLIIPIIFSNIPLQPYAWGPGGSGGGGLTDTELRASPVAMFVEGSTGVDGSLALSGSSETLFAANADRRFLLIQNVAANPIGVNLTGGTAAIGDAGTITLIAGGGLVLDTNCPVNAITVIGTPADEITAVEG